MKKILVLCFVIIITGLSAQDWNITGAGARAAGFGGAFIGIADDATALGWNPGGLTQLYRPEVSVVTRFVSESFDDEFYDDKLTQDHFALNFASLTYPFMDGKFVTALAYQQQLDMFSEWVDDESDSGGAFTVSSGAAYRIMPILSVGLCTNIWMGNWESEEPGAKQEIAFSGFNMNLGAMLNLRNMMNPIPLQVGVSMRTPFNLKVDIDTEYTVYSDSWTNEVEIPFMLGFGAAYFLGDNLILSADYEMRNYGKSEILYDDSSSVYLSDSEENLSQIRIGTEYLFVTDFAVIPLRAGFKTVPTLIANWDEDGEVDGQVVGTGFAFGSGLIFEKFAIDITYDMESTDQNYYDTWGSEYTDTRTKANLGISGTFYF